jgi:predicted amidophosphoribosyltransferase
MRDETPRTCPACRASTMTRDEHPLCTACGEDLTTEVTEGPFVFSHWGQQYGRIEGRQIWVRHRGAWRVLGELS